MKFRRAFNKAGEVSVAKVIGVVIALMVGLVLLPVILAAVGTAKNDTGTLGTGGVTVLGLIPIFFVLGLAIGAIMYVVREVQP